MTDAAADAHAARRAAVRERDAAIAAARGPLWWRLPAMPGLRSRPWINLRLVEALAWDGTGTTLIHMASGRSFPCPGTPGQVQADMADALVLGCNSWDNGPPDEGPTSSGVISEESTDAASLAEKDHTGTQ